MFGSEKELTNARSRIDCGQDWRRSLLVCVNLSAPIDYHSAMTILQSLIAELSLASMTIRNLDDQLKKRLRVRAASNGRSMEEEARDILRSALSTETKRPGNLAEAIRARIAPLGGVNLEIPPREPMPEPIDFG
jgi:antitoxin FitA